MRFAFVSCQDVNEGTLNAYRRMIFEDERAAPADQLGFILHLGDFIYEVVEYPEEVKQTRYDRTIFTRSRGSLMAARRSAQVPLSADGRRLPRHLSAAISPIQTCRMRGSAGRSWRCGTITNSLGRAGRASSRQEDRERPGQSIKVAANQAWFEYLPARVTPPSGSLRGVRAIRQRSRTCRSSNGMRTASASSLQQSRGDQQPDRLSLLPLRSASRSSSSPISIVTAVPIPSATSLSPALVQNSRSMFPEDAAQILDGGRAFNGGNPPNEISFNGAHVPNPRKDAPPQTIPRRHPEGLVQAISCADRLRPGRFGAIPEGAPDWRSDPHRTFRLD